MRNRPFLEMWILVHVASTGLTVSSTFEEPGLRIVWFSLSPWSETYWTIDESLPRVDGGVFLVISRWCWCRITLIPWSNGKPVNMSWRNLIGQRCEVWRSECPSVVVYQTESNYCLRNPTLQYLPPKFWISNLFLKKKKARKECIIGGRVWILSTSQLNCDSQSI